MPLFARQRVPDPLLQGPIPIAPNRVPHDVSAGQRAPPLPRFAIDQPFAAERRGFDRRIAGRRFGADKFHRPRLTGSIHSLALPEPRAGSNRRIRAEITNAAGAQMDPTASGLRSRNCRGSRSAAQGTGLPRYRTGPRQLHLFRPRPSSLTAGPAVVRPAGRWRPTTNVSRFRPIIETDFFIVERWIARSDGRRALAVGPPATPRSRSLGTVCPDSRIADRAGPAAAIFLLAAGRHRHRTPRATGSSTNTARKTTARTFPPTPSECRPRLFGEPAISTRVRYRQFRDGERRHHRVDVFGVVRLMATIELEPFQQGPGEAGGALWRLRPDPFLDGPAEARTADLASSLQRHPRHALIFPDELGRRAGADAQASYSRTIRWRRSAGFVAATETGWRRYGSRRTQPTLDYSRPALPLPGRGSAGRTARLRHRSDHGPPGQPVRPADRWDRPAPASSTSTATGLPGPGSCRRRANSCTGAMPAAARFTGPVAAVAACPNLRDLGADGIRLKQHQPLRPPRPGGRSAWHGRLFRQSRAAPITRRSSRREFRAAGGARSRERAPRP